MSIPASTLVPAPTAAPTPAAATALAYAPAGRSRRRVARRVVVALVALAAALGAWRVWPPLASHLNLLGLQRRCLAHAPPPGRILYDDDPARVAGLLGLPGYAPSHPALPRPAGTVAARENPAFRAYRCGGPGPGRPVAPAAFLGRLTSPSGNVRLVAVTLSLVPPGGAPFEQFAFQPEVEAERSLFGAAGGVGGTARRGGGYGLELFVAPGDRTRVTEGQIDPADPSHFTIDYDHNGVAGRVDGWLNDDDTVTLGPRAGDVLEMDSTYRWWSPAPGGLPPHAYDPGVTGRNAPSDPATRPALPKRDDPRFRNQVR